MACFVLITILLVSCATIDAFHRPHFKPPHSPTVEKACPPTYEEHPLVLISLDGFRADYLSRGLTPTIKALGEAGVKAPFMKPSFPSSTFPNHYTLVTGMMPAYHGIVHNRFFDPDLNERFDRGSYASHDKKFWGGEPIWRTVMKNNKIAATYFWPGSEVRGKEPSPGYWFGYNQSVSFNHRVNQVLEWLDLPKDRRPSFMTLYLHEPDRQGHKFGPYSDQVDKVLKEVDQEINNFLNGLEKRNLLNCVNILLVADHGMAEAGPSRVIEIKDYIPEINQTRYFDGVFARFQPMNKSEELTMKYMNDLSCKEPEMRVYHKRQLPVRWHMSGQKRVEDIVLDLDKGYQAAIKPTYEPDAGDHGYDNYFSVMNALFIAHGPDIKKGMEIESFQNIELYNLMCDLMKIAPAPNNGTWGALHHILNQPPHPPSLVMEHLPSISTLPKHDLELFSIVKASKCPNAFPLLNAELKTLYEGEKKATSHVGVHLPWGTPLHGDLHSTVSLLIDQDHITAYSKLLHMPLWSSFTIAGPRPTYKLGSMSWITEPRLPTSYSNRVCISDQFMKSYGVFWEPLFHPQFSSKKEFRPLTRMSSNAIPMSKQLSSRWSFLRILIADWLQTYKTLNIIVGPVFDYNSDTFVDDIVKTGSEGRLAVPTHMFMVATRCQTRVPNIRMCPAARIDTMAFIIPQSLIVTNCMDDLKFVQEFSAKVQDVEKITGLGFFPWLPFYTRVKQQIRIHSNIWGYETWANRLRSDLYGLKK